MSASDTKELLERVRERFGREKAVEIIAKFVPFNPAERPKFINIPSERHGAVRDECRAALGEVVERDYCAERREASRVMLLALKRFVFADSRTDMEDATLEAVLDAIEKLS